MKAILIICAGLVLAWLYGKAVSRLDGEDLMTLGGLVCLPWAAIVVGVMVALVVLT